jgi:hypothetical protein
MPPSAFDRNDSDILEYKENIKAQLDERIQPAKQVFKAQEQVRNTHRESVIMEDETFSDISAKRKSTRHGKSLAKPR